MRYDAIIIGAGIGGLTVDAILTLNGYKTLLIEKNNRVGGRCSGFVHTFKNHKILVDYGCHVINRCQYGPIQDILERLNVANEMEWFNSDKIPFIIVDGNNIIEMVGVDLNQPDSIIPFNRDKLIKNGLEPVNYEKLYNKMLEALRGVSQRKTYRYDEINFRSWVNEKQFPPGIKDILTFLFIAGLVSLSSEGSVGEYLRCIIYVIEGSVKAMIKKRTLSLGYPIGGCVKIPETMWLGIERLGGEIKLSTLVKEIVIEDNKATGIITNDGKKYEAPLVISDIGIKETFANLVGKTHLSIDYLNNIKKFKPSLGVLVLRVLLDKKITDLPYLFAVQKDTEKYFKQFDEGKIPEFPPMVFIPVISNMSPNLVPDGYQLILPAIVVNYDAVKNNNWEPWQKSLEDAFYQIFPDAKDHIVWKNFFNPKEAEYLWGKEGGPCIGLGQLTNQVGKNKPDFQTPIEGLLIVGADAGKEVSGVGVELAATSGIKCAEYILKMKEIK